MNSAQNYSTTSPFKYGIKKSLHSWKSLCILGLPYFAVFIVFSLIYGALTTLIGYSIFLSETQMPWELFLLAGMLSMLASYASLYVLYQGMWNIHTNKRIKFQNFWQPDKIINFFIGSLFILIPLYIVGSIAFLIIQDNHTFKESYAWVGILSIVFLALAGIIIPRFSFWHIYVVAENYSAFAAYKASWKLTSHHIVSTYVLCIKFLLLQCLGYLAFGIGVFVTYPAGILAYMYVWSQWTSTSLYTPQMITQSSPSLTQP